MIGRIVPVLTAVVLLVGLGGALGPPPPVASQDLWPTPVGRLGGREPLPTAEGMPRTPLPQSTPAPAGHPLVGAWLFTFAEADWPSAQILIGDDGLVTFFDGGGNRGAGVWMASGSRRGILAVAVQAVDASEPSPRIVLLHGTLEVGTQDDAAMLDYTTATVDASGTPTVPAGPFTATGHRVSEA